MEAERQKHTELLARSFKHKVTAKYVPEDEKIKSRFSYLKRPIVPLKNRRLDMLSKPNKINYKYEIVEEPSTIISRAALEAMCTPRLDHLSRPTVRYLEGMKKERGHFGKAFLDTMNDRIAMSLDTIYYHNVKSLMNIEASKKKSAKSLPPKKAKCWDEVGDKERLNMLALPKAGAQPKPPPRRKRKKLAELKPGIDRLAIPLHVYRRPSQDTVILRLKISPDALKYEATERLRKLAEIPPWKLYKPYVPEGVKRGALEYQITERTTQLAVPHPRAHAVESDLKENPYDINPNALTYKATPRIIELAKPVER